MVKPDILISTTTEGDYIMNMKIQYNLNAIAIIDIQIQQELVGKASYKRMAARVRKEAGNYQAEAEAAIFRASTLYTLSV